MDRHVPTERTLNLCDECWNDDDDWWVGALLGAGMWESTLLYFCNVEYPPPSCDYCREARHPMVKIAVRQFPIEDVRTDLL